MLIKEGTRVETASGERVGTVGRVVIDPRNKQITHIVVDKGGLFSEDRVLPAELIVRSDEDLLVLSEDTGDMDRFPEFEVSSFVMLDDRDLPTGQDEVVMGSPAPSAYPYPTVGPHHYWGPAYLSLNTNPYRDPGYSTVTQQNIPDESVALKKGAAIICEDGEKAGEVYEVIGDESTNEATHLVISKGLLSTTKKIIPANWIVRMTEEEVHLGVRSELIDRLPDYEGE